ncbi:MAG: tetratricopeptide repeat protein [Flavobacteriales bacterium]
MSIRLFIIALLIMSESCLFAQNEKIDSLLNVVSSGSKDTNQVKSLNALSWQYFLISDFVAAKKYADQSILLATSLNFLRGKAEGLNYLGNIYAQQTEYALALEKYHESLEIKKEINDVVSMGASYNNIGNIFWNLGNLPEALNYHLKALDIREKSGNQNNIAQSYSNIGLIFLSQKKFKEALEYFNKAVTLQENLGNKYALAITYNNIGNVYENIGNKNDALKFHVLSKNLREEIGDKYGLAQCYANLGVVYKSTDLNLAEENFKASLALSIEIGDRNNEALCYIHLSSIEVERKNITKSESYINKAFLIANEIKSVELLQQSYLSQTIIDTLSKKWKDAFYNLDKYIVFRDSLVNQENSNKILKQQMQYDFDKKTAVLEEQRENDRQIAEAKRRQQQLILYFTILGLLLLLVFLGLVYNRFKVTQKQKAIIEEQKLIVEERNKEITDSIFYAKRIQEAILPAKGEWRIQLPESFVLYQPKDIVAGDFYWMQTVDDFVFIAAADCTGHGVPGAMVSVVCSNALTRAVVEEKLLETNRILVRVREIIIDKLSSKEGETVRDGMDICLVRLNKLKGELQFSGANRPLWLIRDNELLEYKPDKQAVSYSESLNPYSRQSIVLNPKDTLYLTTDGFADQFGGGKGKKLGSRAFKEMLLANNSLGLNKIEMALSDQFDQWKKHVEQIDDVCIIGFRI